MANRRIATDGIDVFVDHLDTGELARAGDRQLAFREVIGDYLRHITWEADDEFPRRLSLRKYGSVGVVIDPRFAWGAPIVNSAKVPVSAVLEMWRAGEQPESVAEEYGLSVDQVEAVIRVPA